MRSIGVSKLPQVWMVCEPWNGLETGDTRGYKAGEMIDGSMTLRHSCWCALPGRGRSSWSAQVVGFLTLAAPSFVWLCFFLQAVRWSSAKMNLIWLLIQPLSHLLYTRWGHWGLLVPSAESEVATHTIHSLTEDNLESPVGLYACFFPTVEGKAMALIQHKSPI